jgi:hypothetical protein
MKALKLVLLLAISSVSVWSCKQTVLQEDTNQGSFSGIQALVMPQPSVVLDPPIAQDFIIQQLDAVDLNGNNLLFKAVFKADDRRLANIRSLPIQVSERTQVVLHDDGLDGDERAGDGVFSAFVKEDIPRLTALLTEKNAELESKKRMVTQFAGRSMVTNQVPLIDLRAFASRQAISIGSGVATANVTLPVFNQLSGNSLMIKDLAVVADPTRTFKPCAPTSGNPNGVWTFKSLMTNMANTSATGVSVDDFVKSWVNNELFAEKSIASSGDITTLPIRDNLTSTPGSKKTFISAWLQNSGFAVNAANIANWQVLLTNKLEFFPVRLMAIVNRLDLRGNFGYTGNGNSGGEGRFVFCFIDAACTANQKMTIILEYGIPITNCSALQSYAQQWYNLKNLTLGSAAYNTALEAVTNVFTNLGAGGSTKANSSALNHLRTNEFIMAPWTIRDFEINSTSHKFQLIHPEKEPMSEANSTVGPNLPAKISSLIAFANSNATTIETEGNYTMPTDIKSVDARMPSPSYIWSNAGITSDLARHKLSLNTCSGCHAGETQTFFTHIFPANFGTAVPLSSFLTGLGADANSTDNDADPIGAFWISDPAGRPTGLPTQRGFNDLFRRANHLDAFITSSCNVRGTVIGLADALSFKALPTSH